MPRKRAPGRLDRIADAATDTFIQHGFSRAKITAIAEVARVGPGTVYLYAESKDALFDLAVRRSLEDPTIWALPLPHPAPAPGEVADHAWRCLQNAAQFPRLWLAIDSSPPADIRDEVGGILQELGTWLERYRRGIKLIERSATDWPDVTQVFFRRFWRGGVRRIADYFGRRMREGALGPLGEPLVVAHFVVETLSWMSIHRYWSWDAAALPADAVPATGYPLLLAALTPNR